MILFLFFLKLTSANLISEAMSSNFDPLPISCILPQLTKYLNQTNTMCIINLDQHMTPMEHDLYKTINENYKRPVYLANSSNIWRVLNKRELFDHIIWFLKSPLEMRVFKNYNQTGKMHVIVSTPNLTTNSAFRKIILQKFVNISNKNMLIIYFFAKKEIGISNYSWKIYQNIELNCADKSSKIYLVKECKLAGSRMKVDEFEVQRSSKTCPLNVKLVEQIPYIFYDGRKQGYRGIEYYLMDTVMKKLSLTAEYYVSNVSNVSNKSDNDMFRLR